LLACRLRRLALAGERAREVLCAASSSARRRFRLALLAGSETGER
jgi:hypothetical protein